VKEAEPSKLFPGYLVVLLIVIIGLFPQLFIWLLIKPVELFTSGLSQDFNVFGMINNLQSVSIVIWAFILAIAMVSLIKYIVLRKNKMVVAPTWGCAYIAPNSKMQYTASSYVRSYRKLIGPLLQMNKKEDDIKGVFSEPIHSQTHPYDKVEAVFIDLPLKLLNKIMARVRFIQNGNMRFYILYGVLFIFIVVIISLLSSLMSYMVNLLKQI
jgi:hydrogenase-4 component B